MVLVSYKTIGRNIRQARVRAGLTQEQTAELLKISQLHFGRLERGERPASLEQIARIAQVLEVSTASLLSGCTLSKTKADTAEDMTDKAAYQKISAEEAYEMMASQEVVVVDVRTREEYDGGHIENAVLVPNESIGSEMPEALPDKEATLLVYCRSGRRSKDAAQKLLALGYQSVYDFGGVIDWPYELVKEG